MSIEQCWKEKWLKKLSNIGERKEYSPRKTIDFLLNIKRRRRQRRQKDVLKKKKKNNPRRGAKSL